MYKNPKPFWMMPLFFAITYIGPVIIWKISSILFNSSKSWASFNTPGYFAYAEHDFSSSNEYLLSFRKGDLFKIHPNCLRNKKPWMKASNSHKIGYIPITHVKINRVFQSKLYH